MLLGSLSNEDDYDGVGNVAKRMRFASFQTSSRLFGSAQLVNCTRFFLELNSYGLHLGSKRQKKILRRIFNSAIKRRIRRFDVVAVKWTSRNVLKSVMHVQSCCFAHKINCFFLRCRCTRGGCLSFLLSETDESTWDAGIFISQSICSVFSRITTCDAAAEPATRRLRGRCAGGVALIVKIVRRPKRRHFSRMVRAFLPRKKDEPVNF